MNLLFKYRWFAVILIIVLCIAGTRYLESALIPNNAISIWFTENDPALKSYKDFTNEFGNDRIIVLALKDSKGILNSETLQTIQQLTNELSRINGIRDVLSINTAKDFRKVKQNDTTRIRFISLFEGNPGYNITPGLREEILSSSLIVNRFINKGATMALLIMRLDPVFEVDKNRGILISEIEKVAGNLIGEENVHLGGLDIITEGLNKLSQRDFVLFTSLGFALMFIIIGLFYRRLSYLVYVLLVSATAIWASLVIYGMLGFSINIFTVISPPLIITLGIITMLHIINEYENLLAQNPNSDANSLAREALQNIFKPTLFAVLTTIIGFLSLFTSSTSVLKEFGFLSSLGVFLMFLFSFLYGSLILPMQKKVKASTSREVGLKMGAFAIHILKHSGKYALLSGMLLIIFLIGVFRINNDMYPFGYFPRDHRIVQDHRFMLRNWGEYYPIDMVLKTEKPYNLQSTQVVKAILNFDLEILSHQFVRNSFNYTHLMQRFARVAFRKDLQQILQDPFVSEKFISQFTEQIQEKSSGLINEDFSKARITITGPILSIRELEKSLKSIDSIAEKKFAGISSLSVTGYPVLYIKMMNYAFNSMQSSLFSSFILIFISMALMLKSIKIALIALIPNVFPVIILLGFLGFSQINLDLATCTVTAIVMGIAVDDTIYFLHRYQKAKREGGSVSDNINQTHFYVGRVILISSLVLFAGFSILLMASLKTVFYFGLLAMVSVVAAIIGDLLILPLLLKYTDAQKRS